MIAACQGAEEPGSLGGQYDEDAGVFFLELLVKVVLQNRDRVTSIWPSVRDHLYWIFVRSREPGLLVERAAVGLLRMSIRLLRREEMAAQVCGYAAVTRIFSVEYLAIQNNLHPISDTCS